MERDFLGLGSKGSSMVTVKEETSDSSRDSPPTRQLGMHWPLPNNNAVPSQFLSFRPSPDGRSRKSNDRTLCSVEAFDSSCKPYCTIPQNGVVPERLAGNQYSYGLSDFEAYSPNRPSPVRIIRSGSNQQQNPVINVPMTTPAHLLPRGMPTPGAASHSQPVAVAPIMAPPLSVVPAASPVVGTTDMRYATKPCVAPAQLTIFYAGSVCVYDDVSPEKAQAIMLLAGNGFSAAHNNTFSTAPLQSPIPCTAAGAGYIGSHTNAMKTVPVPAVQSPINGLRHGGMSCNVTSERTTVNAAESLPISCAITEKIAFSAAPGTPNMIPSAVGLPQMRKASLARFLEKRKERMMSASPYIIRKEAESTSSSVNSGRSLMQPIDLH